MEEQDVILKYFESAGQQLPIIELPRSVTVKILCRAATVRCSSMVLGKTCIIVLFPHCW